VTRRVDEADTAPAILCDKALKRKESKSRSQLLINETEKRERLFICKLSTSKGSEALE
jgi:hypothetical protein